METTQKVSGWWVLNILKALKLICLISWKVEGEEKKAALEKLALEALKAKGLDWYLPRATVYYLF